MHFIYGLRYEEYFHQMFLQCPCYEGMRLFCIMYDEIKKVPNDADNTALNDP